jgi:ABC-type Zn uptake system ZnuABC Zn-binding protein ZnuA
MLVTNHESFGYFADRYGFIIMGTIIPNVSTGSSPSAQQLVELLSSPNFDILKDGLDK